MIAAIDQDVARAGFAHLAEGDFLESLDHGLFPRRDSAHGVIDLSAVAAFFRRERHDGVVDLGRDGQGTV